MVLDPAMNRVAYVLAFAVLFLIAGVLISIPFNHWYTETYVKGEEDIGLHLWVSVLGLWPALFLVGGWLGNRLFKRNLRHRSKGRVDSECSKGSKS